MQYSSNGPGHGNTLTTHCPPSEGQRGGSDGIYHMLDGGVDNMTYEIPVATVKSAAEPPGLGGEYSILQHN